MRPWLWLFLMSWLLSASTVWADDSAAHLTGLELMVRPSVGSGGAGSPVRIKSSPGVTLAVDPGNLLKGDESPYGVGFIGQAFLGYRFHPTFSLGLRGGMRTSSAADLKDGSKELERKSWDAGFYLRGYVLGWQESTRRFLDPWVSVGIEYMRDTQTFGRPVLTSVGSVDADWQIDHHAIAVPLSLGVDYRVLSMLSIGPSFEYTLATGKAGCIDVGPSGYSSRSYCTDKEPGKSVLDARTYGIWSVGLDVKLTVF
jgi:hypothetical protein